MTVIKLLHFNFFNQFLKYTTIRISAILLSVVTDHVHLVLHTDCRNQSITIMSFASVL